MREVTDGGGEPGRTVPAGTLVLAATPIGNRGDITDRVRSAIGTADVIAAEDTRRFARLAGDLGIEYAGRVVSYYEDVEARRAPQLIDALRSGSSVLLLTDAGMPSVSDPGYRLVSAAVEAGLPVTCLPGPSAATMALAVSGLATDRFCFEGFLPRKAGERGRALQALASEPRTMVFFEAPHRLAEMLAATAAALGADRPAAVCRELTKTYEEVRRGPLGELAQWATGDIRGEITVVVAGRPEGPAEVDDAELAAMVTREVEAGSSRKDAVQTVAAATGVPKRRVFDAFHHTAPAGS